MANAKRRRTAGEMLRAAREKKGLTQTQAALLVGAKAAASFCEWEADKKTPRTHTAVAIERLFGVPVGRWPAPSAEVA